MHVLRAHGTLANAAVWIGSLVLVAACSGSKGIDFFAPSDETGGAETGGSSGSVTGGAETGGSSGDAGTTTGGTSGDSTGGTGATETGGTDTGGSGPQGGSDAGAGMGGTSTTGGTDSGGAGPSGGTAGDPMGGSGGAGTGGGGAGGAGTGGGGTAGGGTGGAGTGGGGTGGISGASGAGGCTPTTPSTERCDGVDNNCSGGIDEGSACPANCTGATRAGHWYIFCSFETASGATRARTWMQAQDFCTMRNLSLVAIESAEENTFVLDWVEKMMLEDQVWIGANDRDPTLGLSNEGEWVWGTANNAVQFWEGDEDGMAVMNRYSNWATGEPNNMSNEDCAVLSAEHDYDWDDRVCTNEYENFVCESTAAAVGP